MNIIFLDIDGVLNTHDFNYESQSNTIRPARMAILNRILKATRAKIVLSSAWRYHLHNGDMDLGGINWLFRMHGLYTPAGEDGKPDLTIIGVTRPDTMEWCRDGLVWEKRPRRDERGQQITDWLGEHGWDGPYVVLDDIDLGISKAGHPFIHTDDIGGIHDEDADRAIAILGGVEP